MPSYSLERVAETRTVSGGEPLRALAERLRAPLVEPGGALSTLSPEARGPLYDEAKRLATVFQRSSANVEGRNGSLSLRNHQLGPNLAKGQILANEALCRVGQGQTLVHVQDEGPVRVHEQPLQRRQSAQVREGQPP